MLEKKGNKRSFVDLGHNNVYYMKGLLAYLTDQTNQTYPVSFLIVRLRRHRLGNEDVYDLAFMAMCRLAV